ncbi:MAG: chemotaxis protein CheC, partial [Anaerolineae bacterium]
MNLTAQQEDALVELINIGFGRAAAALSELTGQRVLLDVPHVTITPLDQLRQALDGFVSGDIATVHQIFGGQVAG